MRSLSEIVREALKTLQLPKNNPFKQDLRTTGGAERDAGQSKLTSHTDSGTVSSSGRGYSTKGSKGFSRAAKEFDVPQTSQPLDRSAIDDLDETEEIWSSPPVGLRVPELGFGGRGGAGIKNLWYGHRKR